MHGVFQRPTWNGEPQQLAVWWTLRNQRDTATAVCRMFSHQFGHELRLELVDELIASEVCRKDEEILSCQERWRAGLETKGWTRDAASVIRRDVGGDR
jgi:hypothetical protein